MTIYSHLASLYEKGADVDILSFLHANELESIQNAAVELGHLNAKELYMHMNEEFPYFKVRLATSFLKMSVEV